MKPKPTLIVTGAQGFVASGVIGQAGPGTVVHAVSRSEAPATVPEGVVWHVLDSGAEGVWDGLLKEIGPTAVIHTAATADIDFCERNPDLASEVNLGWTRRIAAACARNEVRLVFCSTDTVFDGEHAPYVETDVPVPGNHYARTKVAAERAIAESGARAVVARLALVVGLPFWGSGNSFLARALKTWRDGGRVAVPDTEIRTPVDSVTVGRALLELARGDATGTYHLAGNTRVSRFALMRQLAAAFGFGAELVVAQSPEATVGRAPRPRDVSLDNAKSRSGLATPMLDLPVAVDLIRRTMTQSRT